MTPVGEPTVLISGGSRGLGLALVEDYLEHGWRVATFSRSESPRLKELAASQPHRFLHVKADQSDPKTPAAVVSRAVEHFGQLDALINNAAVAMEGVLATASPDEIDSVIRVNVTAVTLLTRECVREFLRTSRSHPKAIVNISSIVALTGFRGLATYAATKSALLGFTRSLAREVGSANITVNAVLPGFLQTEMSGSLTDTQKSQIVRRTPMGRLGEVKDVLPLVRLLLGPEGRFITGQCFVVDGGATC